LGHLTYTNIVSGMGDNGPSGTLKLISVIS